MALDVAGVVFFAVLALALVIKVDARLRGRDAEAGQASAAGLRVRA